MTPTVSIILPVYNCERFIHKAISSILQQSYTNFECIVIDDNSTDDTVAIVKIFTDARLKLIAKPINTGYVESLNIGIQEASGKYIARMDADDISLPERLGKQVTFLDTHADISVVASKIKLIDERDTVIGNWKNDAFTHSVSDIKAYLPKGNCICHPSIMIRKTVLEHYKYDTNQYGSEDWDLWLRLTADGHKIAKLPDVLLHYRITNASVSATLDKTLGVLQKANRVRKRFLIKRVRTFHLNILDLKVCYYYFHTQLKVFRQYLRSK